MFFFYFSEKNVPSFSFQQICLRICYILIYILSVKTIFEFKQFFQPDIRLSGHLDIWLLKPDIKKVGYPAGRISGKNPNLTYVLIREEMVAPSAKKLPCGHIFHKSCLRSWFQRQQTCPTCRYVLYVRIRRGETQVTMYRWLKLFSVSAANVKNMIIVQ